MYDLLDVPADPECIVQGQVVSNDHLENVLPGEGAVRIKREVLIAAVRRLEEDGVVARDD